MKMKLMSIGRFLVVFLIALNIYNFANAQKSQQVLAAPTCDLHQMQTWATSKNATTAFVNNAVKFYNYAKQVGVNPCLAYAQSAEETGFGKYGGDVLVTYHNTCGLKNANGSGFAIFPSWNVGIEAHIDHLALYAGAAGYPRAGTPDPRHFPYLLGTAKTITTVAGKWAENPAYATKLKQLMIQIEAMAPGTPNIIVTPNALSFSVVAGSATTKTFQVNGSNTTGNLNVSSNSSSFTVSPTSLPKAGGTVTVTYAPVNAGSHSGSITISGGGASSKTVSLSGTASAPPLTFTQGWNFSQTSGVKKDWATDFSKIRNMDYSAGKLYVVSEGSKMVVVNAQTGNKLGELSNQGVAGGALALIDVKVVSDGKIIASNVTTGTNSPLKVYVWDNDNAHPKVLLETTNFGNGISRIGDCIGILGNTTNGSLYFASAHSDANTRIITYKITNGVAATTPTVMQPLGTNNQGMNFGLSPRVQPNADGKYWVTGQNYYPSLFGTDNKLMATANPDALNNVVHGNAFRAFTFKGVSYGVATTYATGATTITGGRFTIFDATNGWAAANKIGEYPSNGLGTTRNTSYSSSVAAAVSGEAGVEVWVLVHNQGIAYFKHGTPKVQNPQAPNPSEPDPEPEPDPVLTVSESALSFSAAPHASQAKTVNVNGTYINGGITLSISGSHANVFSVSPANLAANGGTVTVNYQPTTSGSHSATLTVSAPGVANKTVALSGTASAQVSYDYNINFNEVWNYSQISGKTANWITNGSQVTQNMAFHDGKLYVVQRTADEDNKIHIVNAFTGAKIGELKTTGINTASYWALSSIAVIGGQIIVSNLQTAAAGSIIIYKWDNDNADPVKWLDTSSRANIARTGDKMAVSGDLTNGKVWFGFDDKVYYYKVINGNIASSPTVINLTKNGEAFKSGASTAAIGVHENADGSFWAAGTSQRPARFNASGIWQEDLSSDLINAPNGTDIKFFSFGNKQYAVVADYLNISHASLAEGTATVLDVTNGIASATRKGSYPANGLGNSTVRNTSFRSTVLTHVSNDKAYMWVLTPFQGAAHYMYDAVVVGLNELGNPSEMQLVVAKDILQIRGAEATKIELYNLTGQLIKSIANASELPIDGLKGVYVVVVQNVDNTVLTQKIIVAQ